MNANKLDKEELEIIKQREEKLSRATKKISSNSSHHDHNQLNSLHPTTNPGSKTVHNLTKSYDRERDLGKLLFKRQKGIHD